MHRAYQSVTPANNKLLKKRWDEHHYYIHRRRVSEAAPMIDNNPPQTYLHLHLKLRNLQSEKERLAAIDRDNSVLMRKMSYTMRTRGRVDNWMNYEQKSLNKTKRQQELLKIAHENLAILKRISTKQAHYNCDDWADSWKINRGYLANITNYPYECRYARGSLGSVLQSSQASRRGSTSYAKSVKTKPYPSVQSATTLAEAELI